MRDAWRLAVGTLTAIPVRPPTTVDPRVSGRAVLLAPFAVVPLGLLAGLITWGGREAGLSPLVVACLTVGALAAGSRALHWDGLSDTVDALTASYDRERALEVMRSGNAGPAGIVGIIVVAGGQVGAMTAMSSGVDSAVLVGVLVCLSRVALTMTCLAGVPAARDEGLGAPLAGSVPLPAAVVTWVVAIAVVTGLVLWAGGDWWRGVLSPVLTGLIVLMLVRRAIHRFGGVTGDVYGAAIEISLAALLVSLS